ncbi:hypothetical protein [Clostridium merdae]|uniref:hypothetical protein n=1 Tax=Clostridium merdae TaxID=1958780 RepID=UPI000A26A036|nr:hypothetical protein [Clostridium merdae]
MKKEYWLGIQNEILEEKGIYKLWFFIFIVCFAIRGDPRYGAVFYYLLPLAFSILSLVFLAVIWHVCKKERSPKQNREILSYIIMFLIGAGISIYGIL